ncbi:MAG: hypothetical protein CVV21_12200 [Candidatus Goldiibacteriota bacterium HGW-Goldbacteria-1]|jgi:hypothetical protein|nr:MAG: hypothetical protein CVV21_12200 [Candidatus Goldiibacteriota bacterium HGW-Goldbacteria-1]
MDKNCKKNLFFFLLLLFPWVIFSLDGNAIISNADFYKDLKWTCNDWNARASNTDELPENNDLDYPFYPSGAAVSRDSQKK